MVKRCLVLGSANTLRSDLRAALELSEFEGVVACKGAGLEWRGNLDAWVSLHPDRLPRDIAWRRELGYPDAARTYGHIAAPGASHHTEYKFPKQKTSGSSGLFGIKVALIDLGFDRVVLCGIPLMREEGRIDGKVRWSGAEAFKKGWHEALPHLENRVRSMSGWTKQLLGSPTPEWLGE